MYRLIFISVIWCNFFHSSWPAFKSRGLSAAFFSKGNCLIGNIFGEFQNDELALAGFQKLSAQLREICYSIGPKDLNSPVLKNLLANLIALCAKRQRIY
jgi:hypothetical protein